MWQDKFGNGINGHEMTRGKVTTYKIGHCKFGYGINGHEMTILLHGLSNHPHNYIQLFSEGNPERIVYLLVLAIICH